MRFKGLKIKRTKFRQVSCLFPQKINFYPLIQIFPFLTKMWHFKCPELPVPELPVPTVIKIIIVVSKLNNAKIKVWSEASRQNTLNGWFSTRSFAQPFLVKNAFSKQSWEFWKLKAKFVLFVNFKLDPKKHRHSGNVSFRFCKSSINVHFSNFTVFDLQSFSAITCAKLYSIQKSEKKIFVILLNLKQVRALVLAWTCLFKTKIKIRFFKSCDRVSPYFSFFADKKNQLRNLKTRSMIFCILLLNFSTSSWAWSNFGSVFQFSSLEFMSASLQMLGGFSSSNKLSFSHDNHLFWKSSF